MNPIAPHTLAPTQEMKNAMKNAGFMEFDVFRISGTAMCPSGEYNVSAVQRSIENALGGDFDLQLSVTSGGKKKIGF